MYCHKNSKFNKMFNYFDDFCAPKTVFWKNHYWVASEINCFEPIFGFLMQFWFWKYRTDTWNPKKMFSAPSGRSETNKSWSNQGVYFVHHMSLSPPDLKTFHLAWALDARLFPRKYAVCFCLTWRMAFKQQIELRMM